MRRSKTLRRLLLLLVLIGFCLGAALFGLMAGFIPDQIANLGRPASGLRPHEQVFLTSYLLLHRTELTSPAKPGLEQVELLVLEGSNASQVAAQLVELGVIDDPELLINYLHYRGLDRGIEAGSYLLSGSMSVVDIAQELQRATPEQNLFTIPEGWRAGQIVQALSQTGRDELALQFREAAAGRPDGYSFSASLPSQGGLEGFLFPDSYQLLPETTGVQLALAMLDNFEARVSDDLRAGFDSQGLTLYQGVTLASIVEREAVVADERARIASVFLNRLALGMKLDADPTVQYALGQQPDGSWWKAALTRSDLELDSPYNTYLYPGLPPSPIANPGLASLQAVAFPEATTFLYFRAACDGSGRHNFAVTFEEHVANACP